MTTATVGFGVLHSFHYNVTVTYKLNNSSYKHEPQLFVTINDM